MEVYDKISWQVDGGVPKEAAIAHFNFMFKWLNKKNMLSRDGKEIYEAGVDGSFSLSDNDLTEEGSRFLKENYDKYIAKIVYGTKEDEDLLEQMYQGFKS